ncbi:hypothetical protein CEXT_249691 [Caerostris extrusa]|uniref:Uncharacterized protein n=1 Tax=Caerostris extrusa TaxID=172846 RepID=A0AAV4QL52_CAEEX|nr:hypothetical protein CEXT_249691 [Caerostris extrusa]
MNITITARAKTLKRTLSHTQKYVKTISYSSHVWRDHTNVLANTKHGLEVKMIDNTFQHSLPQWKMIQTPPCLASTSFRSLSVDPGLAMH